MNEGARQPDWVSDCGSVTLYRGDCLDVLRSLPDGSVDAVVTDPPYGLSFMGKRWDYDVPSVDVWAECLRVLKPGGHLLAFAGTRTQHRMCVRIEDAGFEIRDMIAWVYGSGFPKSLDVSKALDKAAGAEREVVGSYFGATNIGKKSDGKRGYGCDGESTGGTDRTVHITAPATDAARQWSGWGTALKPAMEPITVARKPLAGTVAENVTEYGTGAINVDGCRVGPPIAHRPGVLHRGSGTTVGAFRTSYRQYTGKDGDGTCVNGRWPANLVHDGSEEVSSLTGSAARFFYCAKASKADRDEGCEGLEKVAGGAVTGRRAGSAGALASAYAGTTESPRANIHPTVKPTDLMRYLCRLVTPPGGVVLDPFSGSGSTGKAAALEGFHFTGIEREADYLDIAKRRIQHALAERGVFAQQGAH